MKQLLTITALLEGATGIALILFPSMIVSILLGTALTDPTGILIGKLAGGVLTSLAVACGRSTDEGQASMMVKVMMSYNIFTIMLLLHAALMLDLSGPVLWPVVILHFGLALWCGFSLRKVKKIV